MKKKIFSTYGQITKAISPSDTDFDQNFKNDPYQLGKNEKSWKLKKNFFDPFRPIAFFCLFASQGDTFSAVTFVLIEIAKIWLRHWIHNEELYNLPHYMNSVFYVFDTSK